MYDNDSKGISFTAGFFILIALTAAGLLVASAISIPVWTKMTGTSIDEMAKSLGNPAYANVTRIIQTITVIFAFFIPTLIAASLLSRKPLKLLGFTSGIRAGQLGLVVLIMIAALLVSVSLSRFNTMIPLPASWKTTFDKWEDNYNEQVKAILGLRNIPEYILALFIMAFLPALCEETLFRGGLQNFLTRSTKMPLLSIILVSIIFSAIHFSWYGFFSRFFLGFILGFIYHYSGKLWLNILGHFLNNVIAITAMYVAFDDQVIKYWGLLLLPLVIGLLLVFQRISYGSALVVKRSIK